MSCPRMGLYSKSKKEELVMGKRNGGLLLKAGLFVERNCWDFFGALCWVYVLGVVGGVDSGVGYELPEACIRVLFAMGLFIITMLIKAFTKARRIAHDKV